MSREAGMPSARRRAIPGMTPSTAESQPPASAEPGVPVPAPRSAPAAAASGAEGRRPATAFAPPPPPAAVRERPAERHLVQDYGTTRLVNFRLPVDLHDRYKRLVREAEAKYPKLRHPSLTEVIIALLAEGPPTPEGVGELILRKRAAEHGGGR